MSIASAFAIIFSFLWGLQIGRKWMRSELRKGGGT